MLELNPPAPPKEQSTPREAPKWRRMACNRATHIDAGRGRQGRSAQCEARRKALQVGLGQREGQAPGRRPAHLYVRPAQAQGGAAGPDEQQVRRPRRDAPDGRWPWASGTTTPTSAPRGYASSGCGCRPGGVCDALQLIPDLPRVVLASRGGYGPPVIAVLGPCVATVCGRGAAAPVGSKAARGAWYTNIGGRSAVCQLAVPRFAGPCLANVGEAG